MSRVWLADLAQLAALADEQLNRLADAAGFDGRVGQPVVASGRPATVTWRAVSGSGVTLPELAPVRFWRAETAWFAGPLQQDGSEEPVEVPAPMPELGGSLLASPPAPEAVPWPTLWPRLRRLLQVKARGRAPDVPRTVQLVAKGRVLTELPRVQRLRWPERVELWLDRSRRNAPLFTDQARVVQRVRRAVGPQRVRARVIGEADQGEALGAPDGLADVTPPLSSRVLVLGDLGGWGPEAVRQAWDRTAVALRRRGVDPQALVPPRAPARPAWRCVAWERPRELVEAPDAREDRVEALLTLISAAGLVEPGLLRRIRQAWRDEVGDLSVELDLLGHPDVLDFDVTAVVLRPEARRRWRDRYATLPDADKQRMEAILAEWHVGLPGELGLAETVSQCALGWAPETREGRARLASAYAFVARLRDHLDPRLGSSEETASWRDYARRVTGALPDIAFDEPHLGSMLRTVRDRALQDAPPLVEGARPREWRIEQAGADDPEASELPFAIREGAAESVGSPIGFVVSSGSIRALPQAPDVAATTLEPGEVRPLEEADAWELHTPHQRLVIRAWERPPWAVAAGRDRFGLWAEVEVDGVVQRLRWIPPGRYLRGSPETEQGRWDDEGPQHSVVLSQGFWLGDTPVTQALWMAVTGENPSAHPGEDRPVESVSWDDAQAFCGALWERYPALAPRLPTEAEWEYACRAGTRTATWVGDLDIEDGTASQLEGIAWYQGSRAGQTTRSVAMLSANPWGLYDMLGNVREWCQDVFGSYSALPLEDPCNEAGQERVCRGGAWSSGARGVRAAYRDADRPGSRSDVLGFRLAGGPAHQGRSPQGRGPATDETARDAPKERG